jgi:phosphate starvation-inducible membrane PsiE
VKTIFSQQLLDKVGFWASAGCALHCLALPLVVSISAFNSFAFLNKPGVEESIIALSFFLGFGSMVPSYFRDHKKISALYVLVLGFGLIGFSRIVDLEIWEIALTSAGATLVATAHIRNQILCRKGCSSVASH